MVWQKQDTHKAAEYKILSLDDAGHGGLNIQELEYNLPLKQSPKMLNMMIKNGVFGKRYGQKVIYEFDTSLFGEIKAMAVYKGKLYLQVWNSIWKYDPDTESMTNIYMDADAGHHKGVFINFAKNLYFLNGYIFLQMDGSITREVDPYCPDICINRTPAGDYSDLIEDYNRLGAGFKNTFSGDGTSTEYHLIIPKETDEDTRGLDTKTVLCEVDGVTKNEGIDFSVNRSTGVVTFNVAPSRGTNNVVIVAYKTFTEYEDSIMNCKYWTAYGGQNNSRLFMAGNGSSTIYYSDIYNATYFPESNYITLGNTADDVTGFGIQYSSLIVFKPTEIFCLKYEYQKDTTGELNALFTSYQVNTQIGCDMPGTIQYVDNRLTWCATDWGVCTLCSTMLEDEKNVRIISRNINGGQRANGLLQESDLHEAIAIDYDGKYMVCTNNPETGDYLYEWRDDDEGVVERVPDRGYRAYVWDYENSPYSSSTKYTPDFAAGMLAWYLWQNIHIDCFAQLDRVLYFGVGGRLCILNFDLFDYDETPIEAFYQTPLMDFGAYQMLKTIKKVFFEVRGDTASTVRIKYITDENSQGDIDPESIWVNEKLWYDFSWSSWGWSLIAFAKTFARKCSVKKVNLFAIGLSNTQYNRDLTISGIRCEYTLVKEIK